ncbi:MAG: HK97 family phage prohead protease [Devosia sp.]
MRWDSGVEFGAPVRHILAVDTRDMKRSTPSKLSAGKVTLTGYATRYNRPHLFKGGIEVFAPGVFAKSLVDDSTIRFLNNHDEARCIATTRGAGLELKSDEVGLSFRLDLPDTDEAASLLEEIELGEKSEMSVGYDAVEYQTKAVDGQSYRLITAARLFEISAVRKGAVPTTFIEIARSRDKFSRKTKAEADVAAAGAAVSSNFRRLVELVRQ